MEKITNDTILTDENMNSTTDFFYAVCSFVEQMSKTGDPFQSLQDWLSHGDYSTPRRTGDVVLEWNAEREDEDATEAENEKLDRLAEKAFSSF